MSQIKNKSPSGQSLTYQGLLANALLLSLASLAEPLASIIDTALVGRQSTVLLAALSASITVFSAFTWVFNFLVFGSTSLIAYSVGKKDLLGVILKIKISFILSLFFGVLASIILYAIRHFFVEFMELELQVREFFFLYFPIRLLGVPLGLLYTTGIGVTRGLGMSKMPLIVTFFLTCFNISVSYYALNMSDWGIAGVAWGTTLSFLLGCLFLIAMIIHHLRSNLKLTIFQFFSAKLTRESFQEVLNPSKYIFVRSSSLVLALFLCGVVCSRMGTLQLAAYQVMSNIWSFCSYFIDGLGILGSSLVASFLASGRLDEMKAVEKKLLTLTSVVNVILLFILFVFQDFIVSFFTNDQQVLGMLKSIFVFVLLVQLVQGFNDFLDGVIFGRQEYRYAAQAMLVAVFIFYFPLLAFANFYESLLLVCLARGVLSLARTLGLFLKLK